MALITKLMSGCYIDGTCEVFAVYNDVTNELKEIIVKGDSSREVDITIAGETVQVGKHNRQELKFDYARRKLKFFIAATEDDTLDITPRIVCTYYAKHLSRADVIAGKIE